MQKFLKSGSAIGALLAMPVAAMAHAHPAREAPASGTLLKALPPEPSSTSPKRSIDISAASWSGGRGRQDREPRACCIGCQQREGTPSFLYGEQAAPAATRFSGTPLLPMALERDRSAGQERHVQADPN